LHAAAGREQLLEAESHTKPVPLPSPLLVQAFLPQIQAAFSMLLVACPEFFVHTEAVTAPTLNLPSLLH
jgi:hypothetical protein